MQPCKRHTRQKHFLIYLDKQASHIMMEGKETVFFISHITLYVSPWFCRRIKNSFVVMSVDPSVRHVNTMFNIQSGTFKWEPCYTASFFILWKNVSNKVNAYRYTYLHNYSVWNKIILFIEIVRCTMCNVSKFVIECFPLFLKIRKSFWDGYKPRIKKLTFKMVFTAIIYECSFVLCINVCNDSINYISVARIGSIHSPCLKYKEKSAYLGNCQLLILIYATSTAFILSKISFFISKNSPNIITTNVINTSIKSDADTSSEQSTRESQRFILINFV